MTSARCSHQYSWLRLRYVVNFKEYLTHINQVSEYSLIKKYISVSWSIHGI